VYKSKVTSTNQMKGIEIQNMWFAVGRNYCALYIFIRNNMSIKTRGATRSQSGTSFMSHKFFILVLSIVCTEWLGLKHHNHPELTCRERSIRFLLFEIKRAFVYNSTVFKLTDLFILIHFHSKCICQQKIFKIKGYKIM